MGLGSYPKVIQVIEVGVMRGHGATEEDPMRSVTSYFSLDGEPLAERDPHPITMVTLAELKRMSDEHERLLSAIRWALGEEGEFPERDPKKPYGWRSELRRRAGL